MRDEYGVLQGFKPREAAGAGRGAVPAKPVNAAAAAAADSKSHTAKLIDSIPAERCVQTGLHIARGCRLTAVWRNLCFTFFALPHAVAGQRQLRRPASS